MHKCAASLAALILLVSTASQALPHQSPAVAEATQLTATERRVIASSLPDLDLSALNDTALLRELAGYAARELGLRLRPKAVDLLWGLAPRPRNPEAELAAARTNGALAKWIAGLSPRHLQYGRLQSAAEHYRLAARAPFTPLPPMPTLREGSISPLLASVRARLAGEGFPTDSALPQQFDAELTSALIGFQGKVGLAQDGVLGPQTRAALNVSPGERLTQIEANLERLRWLPHDLPADRLEVNVAAAEATLVRQGAPALHMRIVVGDLKHKTPMFASKLESIVFNPPWNVPASIAQNEILPRARRDPGYLTRNNYVFVDGRLQQRPGSGNALGRVKFDFPSPYGVYLHDTPSRSAFARPTRTLSHGCMRLEKPRELALILLGAQGWTESGIAAAIGEGRTRRVALDPPLPLFVIYQTAMVENGNVRFVPDVYGWDAKLTAALQGSGKPFAQTIKTDSDCAEAQSSAG